MTNLPAVFDAGTDVWPHMQHYTPNLGSTTAVLGVKSRVSRRDDGGLIVEPLEAYGPDNPVLHVKFPDGDAVGTGPGFTVLGHSTIGAALAKQA